MFRLVPHSLRAYFVAAVLFLPIQASTAPLLFQNYSVGHNNRRIFQAVMDDLAERNGVEVPLAYGSELTATSTTVYLNEVWFDERVRLMQAIEHANPFFERTESNRLLHPRRTEATFRFILAHEYFHVVLKHEDTWTGKNVPGVVMKRGGRSQKLRALMELQADYLAALYLRELNLPLSSAKTALIFADTGPFSTTEELLSPHYIPKYPDYDDQVAKFGYPHVDIRDLSIELARDHGFYYELFDNELIDSSGLFSNFTIKRERVTSAIARQLLTELGVSQERVTREMVARCRDVLGQAGRLGNDPVHTLQEWRRTRNLREALYFSTHYWSD